MEDVLETAGEVLVDLVIALQEVGQLALYVETTEKLVASKWGSELARIIDLPGAELRAALDALLDQTRTPKESALLLILAKQMRPFWNAVVRPVSIVPKPVESCRFENLGFAVFLRTFSSGLSASASSFFGFSSRVHHRA